LLLIIVVEIRFRSELESISRYILCIWTLYPIPYQNSVFYYNPCLDWNFMCLTAKFPALMYSEPLDPTWNPYLLWLLVSICTTHVIVNSYLLRFFISMLDSHTVINSKTVFYHIYSYHLDPNRTTNFMLHLYFGIHDIKINLNFFCYLDCHLCLYRLYIEVRFLSYIDSIWNKTLHIKYLFIFMWNAYITIFLCKSNYVTHQ
jgi:hypothetical protein